MKSLYYFLVAAAFVTNGCEKQEFEFVATGNTEETYVVDNTGDFYESAQILVNDYIDLLDVPDDAIIGEVNIESLSVNVLALDGNEASAVNISSNAIINGADVTLFNNLIVTVSNDADSWMNVTGLINSGIEAVKNKFQKFIDGTDFESFTLTAEGSDSPTSGNRVHAKVTIRLKSTIKYYQEAEVPWFIHGKE